MILVFISSEPVCWFLARDPRRRKRRSGPAKLTERRPRTRRFVCGAIAGAMGKNRHTRGRKLDRGERFADARLGNARRLMLLRVCQPSRKPGVAIFCSCLISIFLTLPSRFHIGTLRERLCTSGL